MSNSIIVTGATGTIGSHAVGLLAQRGVQVTAVVRDRSKAAQLQAAGVRLAAATFEDPASLRAAFAGANTVVSITPANAHGLEQALASIAAAKAAGVRRLVRVSALKAGPDGPTDNTRQHGQTEAALRASGLAYVILRPQAFFQNLLASLGSIASEGKLYFGSGRGRMGMIDTRDIAECVVEAASNPRFDGETLELTGPASIDYETVASAISQALERPVSYVSVPPEAAGEAARAHGADAWTAGIIRDYCRAYATGWGDFTTQEVERITGHAPRSIDRFAREVLVPALRR
jgi:NAD(P)H dehydrogenase (quinone)